MNLQPVLNLHDRLLPATGGYLFSHKALAKVFRAKVLDAFERAGLLLPAAVPTTWVVDCRAVGDGRKALLYLGRCDAQGRVTFQYRDSRTARWRRTLAGEAFLWLLLQHVLPKGLRRSRNFGFLHHPNSVGAIRLLQLLRHGLVQQTDQIAASRDLSLIVRHLLFAT